MQDQDALKEIARSHREAASSNIWLLYVFIFLILVAVVFLFVYYRWLREPLKKNQRRREVFDRFSRVNELNDSETRYLKHVATQYQLQNQYLIFVKRSLFEEMASRATLASGVEIGMLRDKLYRPE